MHVTSIGIVNHFYLANLDNENTILLNVRLFIFYIFTEYPQKIFIFILKLIYLNTYYLLLKHTFKNSFILIIYMISLKYLYVER